MAVPAVLAVVKVDLPAADPGDTAKDAMEHALTVLEPRFPGAANKLRDAEADVLAYLEFPVDH